MTDCTECKYYHQECNAKFMCRIDVEKIRADAIDEYREKLLIGTLYGTMLPDGFRADVVTAHSVDIIAEQLKEQQNESS